MKSRIILPLTALALFSLLWYASALPRPELVAAQSPIIFSHTFHVTENEIECETCHENVSGSTLANDDNLPTMDNCGECHDVEDEENCGQCHIDPEDPLELERSVREIIFNHKAHLSQDLECALCHSGVLDATVDKAGHLPDMGRCLDCHDGVEAKEDCSLCHGEKITLADIHPSGWRRQHGDLATLDDERCFVCHKQGNSCLECHRGDNLRGQFHEFNYLLTHGLQALSKESDCAKCHDRRAFCNDCHESEDRIPLLHSTRSWRADHGKAARRDIENCASCHDSNDPTCARGGCHSDFDGVRGTNPRIHGGDVDAFGGEGPWHDDRGYFCYQCHVNSNEPGTGFCGYCHR